MTQRFVPGAGKSAMVRGEPSGPMTYLTLGRWGSVIATLTNSTTRRGARYARRLKIWLSLVADWRDLPREMAHNIGFPYANSRPGGLGAREPGRPVLPADAPRITWR